MSCQSDRFLHHLTAEGWLLGSEVFDGVTRLEKVPDGSVLTVEEHRYRRSYQDDEEVFLITKYRSTDERQLHTLTSRFGETPSIAKPHKVLRRKKTKNRRA